MSLTFIRMTPSVALINNALAVLTIIGDAIVVLGLILIINPKTRKKTLAFFGKNATIFAFIVALTATLGSLFYSEIAGFEPCKLCWFQRIFMYPQAILLGIALYQRDKTFAIYSLWLSVLGLIIAGYHYGLQLGFLPEIPCSAVGYSSKCSQRFILNFGYITIPMMAFTAFAMITLFMAAQRAKNK